MGTKCSMEGRPSRRGERPSPDRLGFPMPKRLSSRWRTMARTEEPSTDHAARCGRDKRRRTQGARTPQVYPRGSRERPRSIQEGEPDLEHGGDHIQPPKVPNPVGSCSAYPSSPATSPHRTQAYSWSPSPAAATNSRGSTAPVPMVVGHAPLFCCSRFVFPCHPATVGFVRDEEGRLCGRSWVSCNL